MKEVLEYLRKIDALRAEGSNLFTTARNESRDMTDEEEARTGVINDEIDRLQRQMEQYVRLNNIPRDQLQNMEPITPEPRVEPKSEERAQEKRDAFFKYIRKGEAGLNSEERALVEDSSGLYYVPQDLESQIVTALPQINSFRKYCGIRQTTRPSVDYPGMGAVTVGWGKLELGTEPTDGTPTPSKTTIYAEDLQCLIKLGKDVLADSDANLEQAIIDQATVALADEEAKRFAIGRGHTTYEEPAGITLASITHIDWDTADTLTIKEMLECEYNLGAQYLPGAAWLMNRKTEFAARSYQEAVASGYYGNFMWAAGLLGQPNTFDAFPIFNQNDMGYPADATDLVQVVFGNFARGYRIIDRAGIYVQKLSELYAESGLIGYLIGKRVGGGTIDTSAFYGIGNANT